MLDFHGSIIEVAMKKLAWFASLAVLGLGAMGVTGCARFASYCSDAMDCEWGNDHDYDACEIQLKADADRADNWGCTGVFDDLFACEEQESYCDGNRHWTTGDGNADRCNIEQERYSDCCHGHC
jgi:hypothetical protein